MALVKWPECGSDVSGITKASSNCGAPIDMEICSPKCRSANTICCQRDKQGGIRCIAERSRSKRGNE